MLKSSPVAVLMPVKLEQKSNPNYLAAAKPQLFIWFLFMEFLIAS